MVPAEPAVNSSIEAYVTAWSRKSHAQCDEHPSAPIVLVMQRNKRSVQAHNSPNRERYFASVGVSSSHRSRQMSSDKLLLVESDLPGSIAIFAHEADARVLNALRSPAITSKETGP
jgi:hypothetical protein